MEINGDSLEFHNAFGSYDLTHLVKQDDWYISTGEDILWLSGSVSRMIYTPPPLSENENFSWTGNFEFKLG